MTHEVEYNGEIHEFPNESTPEQISIALKKYASHKQDIQQPKSTIDQLNYVTGMNRTPLDTIRDVVGGATSGIIHGGELANKAIMKIPGTQELATYLHNKLPKGMSTNDEDVNKLINKISSPNKSISGNIAQAVGSYLPYGAVGGIRALGSTIAGAAYGAANTNPDEQNLLGILPNGRVGGAVEGAVSNALLHGAGSLINKFRNSGKINPINPRQSILENKLQEDKYDLQDKMSNLQEEILGNKQNKELETNSLRHQGLPDIHDQQNKIADSQGKYIPEKQASENEIAGYKKNLSDAMTNLEHKKINGLDIANQKHRSELNELDKSKEDIGNEFKNYPASETNIQQKTAIKNGHEGLKEIFKKEYKTFNTEGGGQKKIQEHYNENEIKDNLSKAGVDNKTIKKMGKDLSSKTVELPAISDSEGKPFKLTFPAKNSSVSDHVDFMRVTRDAASQFYRESKLDKVNGRELRSKGNALSAISKDADRRIEGSLTPEEIANFRRIQNGYKTLIVPFNESNTLRGILRTGNANSNLFKHMNNGEQLPLHKYLLERQPGYRQQFINERLSESGHPLSKETLGQQASSIRNLRENEKDFWHILSPKQRKILENHENISQNRNWTDQLKDFINAKPSKLFSKSVEVDAVKKSSPEANYALTELENAHENALQAKNQVSRAEREAEEKNRPLRHNVETEKLVKPEILANKQKIDIARLPESTDKLSSLSHELQRLKLPKKETTKMERELRSIKAQSKNKDEGMKRVGKLVAELAIKGTGYKGLYDIANKFLGR